MLLVFHSVLFCPPLMSIISLSYLILSPLSSSLLPLPPVIRGKDPSAVAVLMEDSAAVAGVFLATTSILLTHLTGSVVYDAVGSITIGGR